MVKGRPPFQQSVPSAGQEGPESTAMSYLGELRTHRRPLAAATAGLSAGLSLSAYTNAAMAPQFLAAFGWSRSDFALTGVITLLTFVFLPLYGRLTDLFGVRRVAVVGVVGMPLGWLAYALMTGPIWQYFAITAGIIALGVATTPAIYSPRAGAGDRDLRAAAAGCRRCAAAGSGQPGLWLAGGVCRHRRHHRGHRRARHGAGPRFRTTIQRSCGTA